MTGAAGAGGGGGGGGGGGNWCGGEEVVGLAEWVMVDKDGVGEPAVCGSHASLGRKCLLASIVDSPELLVLAAEGNAANRTVASWRPC